MGRFMARDYVTIREEQRNGETEFTETSVSRTLLKSAPAKVTRKGNVQPAMDAPSITKKKTYWESNGQVARRIRVT